MLSCHNNRQLLSLCVPLAFSVAPSLAGSCHRRFSNMKILALDCHIHILIERRDLDFIGSQCWQKPCAHVQSINHQLLLQSPVPIKSWEGGRLSDMVGLTVPATIGMVGSC